MCFVLNNNPLLRLFNDLWYVWFVEKEDGSFLGNGSFEKTFGLRKTCGSVESD